MNQVVITQFGGRKFFLVYEDQELMECHPLSLERPLQIGNIYIGRVEKVIRNIQAAFVRLDGDTLGYLPLNDKPAVVLNRGLPKGLSSIAENDRILVQVEQEAQKEKQPRVTGNLSLSGRYTVLDLQNGIEGVSKKIRDVERAQQLKELLVRERARHVDKASEFAENRTDQAEHVTNFYGCILRTACEHAKEEQIIAEYRSLAATLDQLIHTAMYEKKIGCIWQGKKEYAAMIDEYGLERIDEIKTDIPEIYEDLSGYPNLLLYEDDMFPLSRLLGLETELKKASGKKVWLKSGGFIVIEPTEAMVVVDVNTGKSIKPKKQHILNVNMEAAKEIARQIRLRNLSGIIMIDFINMPSKEDKETLSGYLQQELKKDSVPAYFVEITKLDVYEVTRKKRRKPLHELLGATAGK